MRADAGAWLHVDGAFGLWAAAQPALRAPHARASSCADSWATDGHKWLNVPYDCGLRVLSRTPDAHRAAMLAYTAAVPRGPDPKCRADDDGDLVVESRGALAASPS